MRNRVSLVVFCMAMASLTGCDGTECGEGTLDKDGVCVGADAPVRCGPGFEVQGNSCVPTADWVKNYCDPDTTEYRQGKCFGTGGTVEPGACTKKCTDPGAGKACVSGQVFEFSSLVTKGAAEATPVANADKLFVRVFDPLSFTLGAPVLLGEGLIENDKGCFVVMLEKMPSALPGADPAVALGVVDDATDAYVLFASGAPVVEGKGVDGLEVPAMTKTAYAALGEDLLTKGSLVMWFRENGVGANVEGVLPLQNNTEPPFAATDVFYLDAAATGIDAAATTTTSSGIAFLRSAGLGTYSGKKDGCTIDGSLGASAAGTLFAVPWPVLGCSN